MEKRIVILSSQEDYWEACYVDGVCVGQSHHLGEGSGKIEFLKPILAGNGLTLDDVLELPADEIDDENAMETGQFPDKFADLQGDYSLEG